MIAQYRTQAVAITSRILDAAVEAPRIGSMTPVSSYNKDNGATGKPMIRLVPRTSVLRSVIAVIFTSLKETRRVNWRAGACAERMIVAVMVAANKKIYILATLIMIIDDNISDYLVTSDAKNYQPWVGGTNVDYSGITGLFTLDDTTTSGNIFALPYSFSGRWYQSTINARAIVFDLFEEISKTIFNSDVG